jgi:hypothetical protein
MMMLRRFGSLTLKDMRMISRNYYLAAVLVLAALLVVAIRFLLPADVAIKPLIVLWDNTSGGAVRQMLEARAGAEGGTLIVVETQQAYDQELAVPGNRIGIRADGGATVERFELTFQGHESERTRRLLGATMQHFAAALGGPVGEYPVVTTRVLEAGRAIPRPPFNLATVPMAVLMESTMVGIFLAAALLYSEKEERSLRAYRTSPGGVTEYLLARCVAMGLLALISAVPITLLTIGPGANWLVLVPLVFLASMAVTAFIMVPANLFESIGEFIYPAMVVVTILTLPSVSYFMPSFSPAWVRVLPSYPLVFALREAYFPTGNSALLSGSIGQLLLTFAVMFPLAVLTFRRQLVARDV